MKQAVFNKAFIEGKIYDVINFNDFGYVEYRGNSLAINMGNCILPLRFTNTILKPGIYTDGIFYFPVYPRDENEAMEYSVQHLARFVDADTFKDVMAAKEKLEKDEYNHLVTSDKVFTPVIDTVNDSPLIIGLKKAVTAKQCDINRYAEKFGPDFNNDRRKFNGHDITASKYASISSNLDIRTTLIIEDMNPNVANPMGEKIVLTWVGDGKSDTEYENKYKQVISDSSSSSVSFEDVVEDELDDIEITYF